MSFFFVLSGFILTHVYWHRFRAHRLREAARFYVARMARIVPLYWFALLLTAMVRFDEYRENGARAVGYVFLAHATFVQAFLPIGGGTGVSLAFNLPAWSLSVEMAFYLAFPALAFALAVLAPRRRTLIALAVLWYLVVVGSTFVFSNDPNAHWLYTISPFTRMLDFFLGVALALVLAAPTVIGWARSRRFLLSWAEVAALVLLAGLLLAAPDVNEGMRASTLFLPGVVAVVGVFSLASGVLSRVLSARPLVWLGNISYAIFLLHFPVILTLDRHLEVFSSGPRWHGYVVGAVATLVLSGLAYHLLERPLRSRIRHRFTPTADRVALAWQAGPTQPG